MVTGLKLNCVVFGEFFFEAAEYLGQLAQKTVLFRVNDDRIPVFRIMIFFEGDEGLWICVFQCLSKLFQLLAAVQLVQLFSAAVIACLSLGLGFLTFSAAVSRFSKIFRISFLKLG